MPNFKKAYKKLPPQQKDKVKKAILAIIKNPHLGVENKGNLSGVFVYKFKVNNQEHLLAYEWEPSSRLFWALGVYENFYRDLKKLSSYRNGSI